MNLRQLPGLIRPVSGPTRSESIRVHARSETIHSLVRGLDAELGLDELAAALLEDEVRALRAAGQSSEEDRTTHFFGGTNAPRLRGQLGRDA
jgi:hypothetical protein